MADLEIGGLSAATALTGAELVEVVQSGNSRQTSVTGIWTNPALVGAVKEDIFTITDAAGYVINPSNGAIQRWVLGASRTPGAAHADWTDGKSVTLLIDDGTAYAITWTTLGVVWKDGTAPTLATTGFTEINITKEGSVLRGVHVGDFAS